MKSQSLCVVTMFVMLAKLLLQCSSSPLNEQQEETIVYPPDDYHHPPLVNLSLFRYHISSDACQEHETPIKVIIMVKSHVGNHHNRHLLRSAYSAAMLEAHGIRRVFVLAMLKNDTENNKKYKSISTEQIETESRTYGDLIQINYIERYQFLTYKTLMGIKWAVTNCKAIFHISQDDDVFVDVYQLLTVIQSLKVEDKYSMYGNEQGRGGVARSPGGWKYSVTREQYAPNVYPEHLSGFFTLMTLDTAKLLLDNSENFVYINVDDAFISGVIADKVGINRKGIPGMFAGGKSLNCCRDMTTDIIFKCRNIAVEIKTPPTIETVMDMIQHVEKCHTTNLCKPFKKPRNMTNLVCV